MALPKLTTRIEEAIHTRKFAGVVLGAYSTDGKLDVLKAVGSASLQDTSVSVKNDAVFSLASATKFIVSVAAMQCIERGLVKLDTDIADVLPAWRHPKIFRGLDGEGKPILEAAGHRLTLAHLLTHSSGIGAWESRKIQQYQYASGQGHIPDLVLRFFTCDYDTQQKLLPRVHDLLDWLPIDPLLHEPGQSWTYGNGYDWVARIIEELSGSTLEEYCQENIFQPLGMHSTTFCPGDHPKIDERLVPNYITSGDGRFTPVPRIYSPQPKVARGSGGACASAEDFMKLLKTLLSKDDKILRADSIDRMLSYRLLDRTIMKREEEKGDYFPARVRLDHSLAGMVNIDRLSIFTRSAGSSYWWGATGVYWWIDPTAGVCGFFGSALMRFKDPGISDGLFREFERAVYEEHTQRANL